MTPTKEICDGKDNDCDGLPDEGLAKYCYSGPKNTDGVGQCQQGLQVCVAGKWGACVGQVTPSLVESCDNKDNDCNGKVDDKVTQACYSGAVATKGVGLCKGGTRTCVVGKWGECSGEVTPKTEACDNKDNDCDGKTDEGLTKACYTGKAGTKGKGLCKEGVQTCAAGAYGSCVGEVTPKTEACDNKDNDCNGKVDDNVTQACYTGPAGTQGKGLCKGGTKTCGAGKWSSCAGEVLPVDEKCNDNKDNNCDGKKDDFEPCYTGPPGTKGVGLCKGGKEPCVLPSGPQPLIGVCARAR